MRSGNGTTGSGRNAVSKIYTVVYTRACPCAVAHYIDSRLYLWGLVMVERKANKVYTCPAVAGPGRRFRRLDPLRGCWVSLTRQRRRRRRRQRPPARSSVVRYDTRASRASGSPGKYVAKKYPLKINIPPQICRRWPTVTGIPLSPGRRLGNFVAVASTSRRPARAGGK